MKCWAGVDPGKKGAIAVITDEEVRVIDMPLLPSGEVDSLFIGQLFEELKEDYEITVGIEKAQSMPQQGVKSMFNYGQGYGAILAIMRILQLSFILVRPLKWKKYFSLGASKEAAITTAMNLHPDIEYYGPRGGIKDGRAESLLIANYVKDGGK